MRLSDLLRQALFDVTVPEIDIDITTVTDRASKAVPGAFFVAIEGVAADGHDFIDEAVRNGAVAVVGSKERPEPAQDVLYLQVKQPRRMLAHLLHAFHGFPMRNMLVVGVTGTNGKTTTTYLVESILAAAGRKPGLIGTIEYRYGNTADIAPQTTPHPAVLVEYADAMRREGVDALAMEVSSHGLVHDRVEWVPFQVGVLTNVTQDHFDFHGTRDEYIEAKWKLFGDFLGCRESGVAVLNLDDPVGILFHERYRGAVVTYGSDPEATVRPRSVESDRSGIHLTFEAAGARCAVRSPLHGDYNVANILAAAATAIAAELPMEAVVAGIENFRCVPGRFERVETVAPFDIYVDFAHTPDALDRVLASARRLVVGNGRLIAVFGAGGERDKSKRGPMGAAVARHADYAIITKDNSRREDPQQIADQLAAGIEDARSPCCRYEIILDRGEAIRVALSKAKPGDLVFIAGKGHELYEQEAGELRPWDDRKVIREVVEELRRYKSGWERKT